MSSGVSIQLPVKVKQKALQNLLKQKLKGLEIKKENAEKTIAVIEDINLLDHSKFDLNLELQLLLKTVLFKNKNVKLHILIDFTFDAEDQQLKVENYKVREEKANWVTAQLVHVLINNFLRKKILQKSKLLIAPKLNDLLKSINLQLNNHVEVKKGIKVFGEVEEFKLIDLYFKESNLFAMVKINGALGAEITELQMKD